MEFAGRGTFPASGGGSAPPREAFLLLAVPSPSNRNGFGLLDHAMRLGVDATDNHCVAVKKTAPRGKGRVLEHRSRFACLSGSQLEPSVMTTSASADPHIP